MNNESPKDIIQGEYHCPRCEELLNEKRPTKDRFLVKDKERTVRLQCKCGYYEDRIVDPNNFHDLP